MDIFSEGQEVSLAKVLDNREWRKAQLAEICRKDPARTLLSLKLNIPGKIKNNAYFKKIFEQGLSEISAFAGLVVAYPERITGPEAFFFSKDSAESVKEQAVQFEETFPLGRYFDVDVYQPGNSGRQISRTELGYPKRKCFVCEYPAKECARAERHPSEDIKAVINQRYEVYFGK